MTHPAETPEAGQHKDSQRRRRRLRLALYASPLILVVLTMATGWTKLFNAESRTHYENVEDLFKYGSLGEERLAGIPYHIWRVLPEVFPHLMPGDSGYKSFGFHYEAGRPIPTGMTLETIGFPRVANNCAMCHISRYRDEPGGEPHFILSGTNTVVNAQAYFNFLFDAVNERTRFNPDTLLAYMQKDTTFSAVDRALYRYALIPKMQEKMKAMQNRLSWWYRVPAAGPGRWIAFNDLKFYFAAQPQDRSVGNPDVPPLWNMKPKQDRKLMHWDGFSNDMRKSSQNAVIAAGAMEPDIPREDLERLVSWWLIQPAPKYPKAIDATLAQQGKSVWQTTCASCHDPAESTSHRIIPIDSIGTDRSRYDLVTPATVEAYNKTAKEWYGWTEPQIQKTAGYLAMILDGVWMRAPYLHNGSVPTLTDLLNAPEQRPVTFFRGYDVYDWQNVGYISSGPEASKVGFLYDTRLRGNGNGGHLYGTDLPAASKKALIEYLKTL